MKKEEKIEKTLAEDKCFIVSETDKFKYFICKGITGNVYDIIFYKALEKWKCDCDNVKNTPCYHIGTAKRLDEIENSKDDIDFANLGIGS